MSAKLETSLNESDISSLDEENVFSLEGVPKEQKQHKIFDMLMDKDEISWQSILKDLVKTEQMDPWDVDIKLLCDKFVEAVKNFEKMHFTVSGKILLATAILLKMKADKLLTSDIHAMDQLIDFVEQQEHEFADSEDELEMELMRNEFNPNNEREILVPRTPQPRKRKVSIFDLVEALEKALEVKHRRPEKIDTYKDVEIPKKKVDINELMTSVHKTIIKLLNGRKFLKFNEIIPSDAKEDQILTFMPMLHLCYQRRIELEQEKHFGPIDVYLLTNELPESISENIEKNDENIKIKKNPKMIDKLKTQTKRKKSK